MEQITKWKADDGTEFTEESECAAYEKMCADVTLVMSAFPAQPENDSCSFANGGGYLQLSEEVVADVRGKLLDIIATKIDHKWVEESRDTKIHPSYVDRLLGDYDIRPLCSAWGRLSKIDKQWREWGQPYYATHPDEGKQIMLGSV